MATKKTKKPGVPQSQVDAIADRMAALRFATGLNQTDFCEQTDLATNTWHQWENAKGRPELDYAKKLRKRWAVTLDWIYEGDEAGLPNWLIPKLREWERLNRKAV